MPLQPRVTPRLKLREPPLISRRSTAATTPVNNEVELTEELRFEAKAKKREFLNALRARNAANHLRRLPEKGHSLHAVMRGNYNAWDLVPGLLNLIRPATLAYLGIATLGFNRRNAAQLVQLIDSGQIASSDFLCSTMYANHESAVCGDIAESLATRKSRFGAIRCHAKLLLFQTTDRRHWVYEGSANLRSCRAIEQFCMTHDRDLFEFHRKWLDQMLRKHPYKARADGQTQAAG